MAKQYFGDDFEVRAPEDAAGGVLRRIEDDELGLRRDFCLEFVGVECEFARFLEIDRHRHRAVGHDLRLIDRKSRHRVDHLVAGAVVRDRRDRVGDKRLGTGADDDVVRRNVDAAPAADIACSRGAQLVDAGRRRVAVLAGSDRRDPRVLNVHGRRKIGLSDAKRNDVLALTDQRVHFRQHDKSVFGAKAFASPADPGHGRVYIQRCVHERSPRTRAAYKSRNVFPTGAGMSLPSVQPRPRGSL